MIVGRSSSPSVTLLLLCSLAVLAAVPLLVGCGGDEGGGDNPTDPGSTDNGPRAGASTQLIFGSSYASFPSWSPDGTKIAYYDAGLFCIPSTGGAPIDLGSSAAWGLSWSPDGTKFALATNLPSFLGIKTLTYPGAQLTELTTDAGTTPIWSPDGASIIYKKGRGTSSVVELRMISAGGGPSTLLYDLADPFGQIVVGSWSPDGTEVLLALAFPSNLYAARVDGGGLRQISPTDGLPAGVGRWSPDGKWIAFYRGQYHVEDVSKRGIWIMAVSDRIPHQITFPGNSYAEDQYFSWSPDGKAIAFTRAPLISGQFTEIHIWSVEIIFP